MDDHNIRKRDDVFDLHSLSRRSFLRAAALGAASLAAGSLLAACGAGTGDGAPATQGTSGGTTGGVTPTTGDAGTAGTTKDELVIGFPTDVTTLDIHKVTGLHLIGFDAQIADVLIRLDADSQPVAWLAESWEWQDDGKSLVLKIRDNVPMHDGNVLTAEDVRYSIERFRKYSIGASALAVVTNIEALDGNQVKVSMDAPFSPLLPSFAYTTIGIYSKAAIEEAGDDNFHLKPVGPGPYTFKEKKEGELVTLEAFDDYWAGAPKTKFVTVKVLPEMGTRVQALEAGDVDLIFNVSPQDAQRLESNEKLQVLNLPSARLIRMAFNAQNPPVDNKLVRQAIAYGIDRDAIVEGIFLGMATVTHSPGPADAFGYTDAYDLYTYDPSKAKELLQQAGFPDGVSFKLHLSPGRYLLSENVAQAMRSQLQEAGITMEIVPMEWGTLSEFIRKPVEENEMQAAFLGWRSINGDVDSAISDMHSDRWPPNGNNTSLYSNAEYDELMAQEQAEQEPDKRAEILHEMQRILMEDLPFIPLYHNPHIWAARAGVEGVEISPLTCLQPLHTAVVKMG